MNEDNSNQVVNSIEKLADAMNNKYQNTLILSSTKTKFTVSLNPVITLQHERTYKAAIKSFSVYNSIRNVKKDINDTFRYSSDGSSWTNIVIYPGSYNVLDIITEIYRQASLTTDNTNLRFTPDVKTNTITMILGSNYKVDFGVTHNMSSIFGFEKKAYSKGTYRSPIRPKIISFHNILIKTNLISGGYVSSIDDDKIKQNNIIYSIPTFTVPVGSKIIETVNSPIWHPIILKPIDRIQIEIIDENGEPIDFGGEEISIVILIKQV